MKYSHPDTHITLKHDEGKLSFILPRREKVKFGWLDYAIPITMMVMWSTIAVMVFYYGSSTDTRPMWAVVLSIVIITLFIQGYLTKRWSSPPSTSIVIHVDDEWWETCVKVKNLGITSSSMKDSVYSESVDVAREMLYKGVVNDEYTPMEIGVYCDEISQHMSEIKAIENPMLKSWEREDL